MTLAEVSPFVMVTNVSVCVYFCLSAIVADVGRVIEEETSFTVNVAWFPFATT